MNPNTVASSRKGTVGSPGMTASPAKKTAAITRARGVSEDLLGDVRAEGAVGVLRGDPGDDEAGGGRDEKRRDL